MRARRSLFALPFVAALRLAAWERKRDVLLLNWLRSPERDNWKRAER